MKTINPSLDYNKNMELGRTKTVMETLYQNLKKGDNKHNKTVIETLVIKSRTSDEEVFFNLLGDVCDYIYQEKVKSDSIKTLLEPFDEEEDLDCVIIMLCRDFVTSNEITKYIVDNLRYLSDIVSMLSLLFYKKNESNYSLVAENLLYSYDHTLTNEDIEALMENMRTYINDSKDRHTDVLIRYLESKKTFSSDKYEAPYWISLSEGENISLLSSIPVGETYDAKELVKYDKLPEYIESFFYEFVSKDKRDDEDDKSFFYKDLPENIKESINTFLMVSNEAESKEAKVKIGTPERVWGPINRIVGRDCCSGPKGKGPCRMLLCECLEGEDDEELYDPSVGMTWFTGKCDGCNGFIPDLSHTIRFPHRHGGWKGCYCSFECLLSEPPYIIEDEENILLNIMKQNINHIGIMDRSSFC